MLQSLFTYLLVAHIVLCTGRNYYQGVTLYAQLLRRCQAAKSSFVSQLFCVRLSVTLTTSELHELQ